MELLNNNLIAIESSTTDWIIAVASIIAVPGAIAGFVFLFRKDKSKQEQIEKLTGIAEKIEAQNEILKEGNRLLNDQVDILRSSLVLSKQDNAGSNKLAEIEEKKIKLSVKPFFIKTSGQSSQNTFGITLQNIGERAKVKNMYISEGNAEVGKYGLPFLVLKGGEVVIVCTALGSGIGANTKYTIVVEYEDQLKNQYKINCVGQGGLAKISEPIEIIEAK